MIFNSDFFTRENHWQITPLMTKKLLFTVTHALIFMYSYIIFRVPSLAILWLPICKWSNPEWYGYSNLYYQYRLMYPYSSGLLPLHIGNLQTVDNHNQNIVITMWYTVLPHGLNTNISLTRHFFLPPSWSSQTCWQSVIHNTAGVIYLGILNTSVSHMHPQTVIQERQIPLLCH